MATIICKGCGWAGTENEAEPCPSPYHDMRCPTCKSTNLDTSGVLTDWPDYGYGENNFLRAKED